MHLRASDLFRQDENESTEVQIKLPRAAAAAFEEGLELHRAVTGRNSGIGSFIEALVGETSAALPFTSDGEEEAPLPPGITVTSVDSYKLVLPKISETAPSSIEGVRSSAAERGDGAVLQESQGDEARAEACHYYSELITRLDPGAFTWARGLLERLSCFAGHRPLQKTDAKSLVLQLKACLTLEGELERCLAHLLSLCPVTGRGRAKTGKLGALGEELFGLSQRTIERRVALRRALVFYPQIRAAYEAGQLGQQASWLLTRTLGGRPGERDLERSWLQEAKEVTVRRLQDEVRLVGVLRHDILAPEEEDPGRPLSDARWLTLLPCIPGATVGRVEGLTEKARLSQTDNVFVSVRLSEDLAKAFAGAIGAACRWAEAARTPEAVMHLERGEPIPAWVGLMAMIMDFVRTWDDPRRLPTESKWRLYARDRYRCMAPGCTVRSGLELHHIKFRSQGGGDEDTNLITLCRVHHRLGVHGGRLKLTGTAPLELDWRLGGETDGIWYRNDRRREA